MIHALLISLFVMAKHKHPLKSIFKWHDQTSWDTKYSKKKLQKGIEFAEISMF